MSFTEKVTISAEMQVIYFNQLFVPLFSTQTFVVMRVMILKISLNVSSCHYF